MKIYGGERERERKDEKVFSVREWEGLDRPPPAIDATFRLTNKPLTYKLYIYIYTHTSRYM